MRWQTVVVLGVVATGLSACSDDPPSGVIEASWILERADQAKTCAEAQFDEVRLTATPAAGGAPVSLDVPCSDGTAELAIEAGEYTLTGDLLFGGQETYGDFYDHAEQSITVSDAETSVASLAFETSTPTGQLHITWNGGCSFDTVRLDITDGIPEGESYSAPCADGELTTDVMPVGPGSCRWNAVDGAVEVFWADLKFDLTTRDQVLELERVDF